MDADQEWGLKVATKTSATTNRPTSAKPVLGLLEIFPVGKLMNDDIIIITFDQDLDKIL